MKSRTDAGGMEAAMNAMQAAGLSVTMSRLAVWKVLMRADVPLSVPDIQRRMSAEGDSVPLSSVYAALKRLADAGLVAAHVFDGNRAHFALMDKRSRHRIVCDDTGEAYWVSNERLTDAIAAFCKSEGLELQDYTLSIQARRVAARRVRQNVAVLR